MESYEFISPGKIVFGWGRRSDVARLAKELGERAFVVCGSRTLSACGELDRLIHLVEAAGVEVERLYDTSHEPQVEDVDCCFDILAARRAGDGDLVLAIGGGSAIDLAKAAAAMITDRQSATVSDYLEGVGKGLKLRTPPLPVLAIPTTGGTGSEATKNAVISSYDPPFKKSLRSDLMVPCTVLIDPELSVSVPTTTTAWTGMDAITQLIESYLSRFAKPVPQALALGTLPIALSSLPEAVRNGASQPAREAMAHAALMSGMALANSGLGLAHGVAAALGVHSRVTHGLACAMMLPVALRVNRPARESQLAQLARAALGGTWSTEALAADAFIEAIDQLAVVVGIPKRLSDVGVHRDQIPDLVASSRGNSMNGNPVQLSDDELARLLEEML